MEDLYEILNHLLKNEYDLNAVLYILGKLEGSYDESKEIELKYQVSVVKGYLESVSTEIRNTIDELDKCLAFGRSEHQTME